MDFDACASSNAQGWVAAADDFTRQNPAASPFREASKESGLGTNVNASKLRYAFESNEVVSTPAYVKARFGQAEVLQNRTSEWGRRRYAFEAALNTADTALYATLDLDGATGDDTYGPFRLVAEPHPKNPAPIVLPHNSAAAYATTNGDVDEAQICADAAMWEQRAEVAVLRRGEQAAAAAPTKWPQLLASEDEPRGDIDGDLVEVVLRNGALPLSSIATIRVAKAHIDGLAAEYADALLLASNQRPESLVAFGTLTELVHNGELNWEIVG